MGIVLKLRGKGRGVGGGGLTPLYYDDRFGSFALIADATARQAAAVAAGGWFTFPLKLGCRRVWLNTAMADDSGDGLSAATAKKTPTAWRAVWQSGYTPGDQLMVAEGSVVTDDGTGHWSSYAGFSAAYPFTAQSYDPADAANTAKYGRATGAAMPIWNQPSSGVPMFGMAVSPASYKAVQGIEIHTPLDVNNRSLQVTDTCSHIVFQNCRLQNSGLGLQNHDGNTTLVSKCSLYGQWTTGGSLGAIVGDRVDGAYFQDCVFYHCGWKIGANRDDAVSAGGTNFFQHDAYYHASNTNGRFDRCVHIDSANDATNFRGGCDATQIVCWDVPIALTMGGFSSSSSEAPLGRLIRIDDVTVIGGANINTGLGRNWLIQWENLLAGSYLKNTVAFDSPHHTEAQAVTVYNNNSFSALSAMYLAIDNLRMCQYVDQFQDGTEGVRHLTVTNSFLDSTTNRSTFVNTTLTSTSIQNGSTTYPSKITRDQFTTALCTALGLTPGADYAARKKQLVDLMIYRPDISWAPIIQGIIMPAYGTSSTFAAVSTPNMSAVSPPSIFVYHA